MVNVLAALLTQSRHVTRHVHRPPPVSQRRIDFEHKRPRLLRECLAEVTGVFFYVLPGIAAVASFTLPQTNGLAQVLGTSALGGVPWIGIAFAFGIAFAIITCASTSGGHFNPASKSNTCHLSLVLTLMQQSPYLLWSGTNSRLKRQCCIFCPRFLELFSLHSSSWVVTGPRYRQRGRLISKLMEHQCLMVARLRFCVLSQMQIRPTKVSSFSRNSWWTFTLGY